MFRMRIAAGRGHIFCAIEESTKEMTLKSRAKMYNLQITNVRLHLNGAIIHRLAEYFDGRSANSLKSRF